MKNTTTQTPEQRNDITNLLILVFTAFVLGLYLIATTVVISKDGIMYIELAKAIPTEPMRVVQERFFGYPLLIFATHKLATMFGAGPSVFTWIHAAQNVTLLCRVLTLIPLYSIGKLTVGRKWSFWAILILILLPYPAEFGSDVLRDWPHILFLITGLFCLLRGAERGEWWLFGGAGLAAGLGHTIRPECAQLLIYGTVWIAIRLIAPRTGMSRCKLAYALIALIIGFVIPAGPFMAARGRILPEKIKVYISAESACKPENIQEPELEQGSDIYTASSLPGGIVKGAGRLASEMSDNLFYYFVPPLVIGVFTRLRRKSVIKNTEKFFIPAFICVNVLIVIILYNAYHYMSRRHCLPLIVLSILYVPVGLEIQAQWLEERFCKNKYQTDRQSHGWFLILLVIGLVICLPKLLRPMGIDKQGFRAAAIWLNENTDPKDVIAVPDPRINFYAERKGLIYTTEVPEEAGYVVWIAKNKSEVENGDKLGREVYSVQVEKRKGREKKLLIYRTM